MKALAAAVSGAALAASIWLGWLSHRPLELSSYETSTDLMRVTGLAISIGILTVAVLWMAIRRGVSWTSWIWIGAAGVLDGRRRRPAARAPDVGGDRRCRSVARRRAAVAAAIVATPRFASVPRRPAAVLLAAGRRLRHRGCDVGR